MDSIKAVYNDKPDKGLNELINRIQLILSDDVNGNQAVILVEGKDDQEFIKHIFGENKKCLESYGGVEQLLELISSDELTDNRIIAIRDRDYSNPLEYPVRVFAYDCCSMELMILHHPEMRRQMEKFYDVEEYKDNFPIRILRLLAPFSILRKLNYENDMHISFGNGVMSGCSSRLQFTDMEVPFGKLMQSSELEHCKLEATKVQEDELWNITNGHDICSVLGSLSSNGKKQLGADGYRELMIKTYRRTDFQSTALYKELDDYSKKFGVEIFDEWEGEPDDI